MIINLLISLILFSSYYIIYLTIQTFIRILDQIILNNEQTQNFIQEYFRINEKRDEILKRKFNEQNKDFNSTSNIEDFEEKSRIREDNIELHDNQIYNFKGKIIQILTDHTYEFIDEKSDGYVLESYKKLTHLIGKKIIVRGYKNGVKTEKIKMTKGSLHESIRAIEIEII
ncbi:hypothetical protein ACQV2X_07605 [Facklamia sp. P12945]|uniref:hypothetical protein n=1 Tax=unclassified Facklamia TaxID=2622293 RepID=UPI003D187137